jgi:glycosyltransferase involved in cell wall biosynthesis
VVKIPISAVLITKNAEEHLARVLAALAWCDEIVVLDSGSTDRTCELARAAGARVEHQDFLGFGPQKRRAVALARHDWVLSIDADEVLDEVAASAISALPFATLDPRRAFAIRRRTYVGTHEICHGVWNPDWVLRLFNRSAANFNDNKVHEAVVAAGPVERLAGSMHHYSFRDLGDLFKPGYARLKADRFLAEGRRAGTCKLAARFAWGFTRSFVLKQGFRDGPAGVVVAASAGLDSVLGLALAEEKRR